MSIDIQSIRRMNLRSWVDSNGGHANVVRAKGLTASQASFLSQVINGYSFAEKAARSMEGRLGLAPGALDSRDTPIQGVSHDLRHLNVETVPLLEWGNILTEGLPDAFWLVAPDESMLPRIAKGERVLFSTVRDPSPGDEVLLRDQAGNAYIRVYRERSPGLWTATTDNPAYLPLESERDGLKVLAVMVEHIRKRRN